MLLGATGRSENKNAPVAGSVSNEARDLVYPLTHLQLVQAQHA